MNSILKPVNILIIALGLALIQSCKKDDVAIVPKVETSAASQVTLTSAKLGGSINSNGGSEILAKGICYGTTTAPTVSNDTTNQGGGSADFEATLKNLQPSTKYYARAYATNNVGTSYGSEVSFTTATYPLATLTTTAASAIKGSSAQVGGNVTNDGGSEISERGVVYSVNHNPTLSDAKFVIGNGAGSFAGFVTELQSATTYYARAYATNLGGTAYGDEVSFTTLAFAQLTTKAVTSISEISAISGGTIVSDGGHALWQYGLVWSENQNPTFSDPNTINGVSTSDFNGEISPLKPGKTYYVRAYAVTEAGFAYGNQVTFNSTSTAVTDGLVAYYKFNNNALDYSGNGRNLTATNISYTTDKNSTASSSAYFNGSAKMEGSIDFGSSTAASVSFWFNSENSGFTILNGNGYLNAYGNSSIGFGMCVPGCNAANNPNIIPFYEWHHMVGTYDGTDIKLYVDGVLVKTTNFPNAVNYSSVNFAFGYFNSQYWQGKLDNVKLYNRALTAADVTALYNE